MTPLLRPDDENKAFTLGTSNVKGDVERKFRPDHILPKKAVLVAWGSGDSKSNDF